MSSTDEQNRHISTQITVQFHNSSYEEDSLGFKQNLDSHKEMKLRMPQT